MRGNHASPLRMKGGDDGEGGKRGLPMGVAYGLGFGAITAGRICQEAHLQGYFMRVVGMPPAMVAIGWTSLCFIVAIAEPLIGVAIDNLRNRGVQVSLLLRALVIPWAFVFFLVWRPAASPTPLLFLPVILLSLLQASLNLGFLSVYPSLFATPEARTRAMVPQQSFVVTGLLLGMTLPAILSNDWANPLSFAIKFSSSIFLFLASSVAVLTAWEANATAKSLQPKGGFKAAAAPLKPRAPPSGIIEGLKEIMNNANLRRIMASIFIGQVGNALLASSLPLFCREVVDLSQPIGPFFGGIIPKLSSQWQFSACFALFYLLGGATAGWWSRFAASRGTVYALRVAMSTYSIGCIALALGPGGYFPPMRAFVAASSARKFFTLMACYAINGLSLGGLVSLPDVALAEGVKELEASGAGGGKAGKVYGAKQLVYRLGSAVQGVVTALVISSVAGSWKRGLPILSGILPAVFYLLAALVLPQSRTPSAAE